MLGSHDSHADQTHAHLRHAASLMTDCANRFVSALDANQRGKATFPFDADERMNWHYLLFAKMPSGQNSFAFSNISQAINWAGSQCDRDVTM
jgi:hypothetical protein